MLFDYLYAYIEFKAPKPLFSRRKRENESLGALFFKKMCIFVFLSSFINLKNKIMILKRNTLSNIIPKCKTSCVFYLLSFVLRLA